MSTLKKTNSNYAETYYMTYLQEISFDNGKVTFIYNNGNMLLQECKVTSQPENKVVRDVFFDYYTSLPGTTNNSLANNNSTTIQDIRFTDANAANIEKYHFDYYEAASNDPDQFAFCTGKDYWGYCNGQYNTTPGSNGIPISSINISSPPNNYYSQSLGGGPERRAAFLSYKLPGMIKKIYYPTGGYTEFKYEANKFNNDGVVTDGPGIRLQQQISDDGQGNKITKDYRYGENEDGLGVLLWKPAKEDYTTLKVRNFLDIMPGTSISYPYNYSFYRWRVYSSEPCPDLQQAIHQPIYYSRVTEYNSTTTTLGQNGRTIYTYNVPTFSKPYASMSANESYYTQSFIFDNWSTSQISSKTIQKNVGGATPYKTISQTNYNYLTHNDVNIPQTIVYRMHEFADDDPNYSYYKELAYMNNPPPYGYGLGEPSRDVFYLVNKPIKSGIMKLSSETTTQFDDAGGTVVTTTSNSYQSNYQLRPYKVSVDKSNGRLSNTYFNYFADLPTRTIQTESASDGSNAFVTGGNSISYYKYGMVSSTTRLDIPAPVSFSAVDASGFPPVAAGDFKPRVAIVYDANNNPQKATPQDNSSTSYLWDYRKMYPIAEATNATADQIAYTSFEADGTGNWSYTGTVSTASSTALPPTGAKYYNLTASTPLSKSVTNGQVYTLAYWRDNTSAYSITGATVNSTYTGQTCNGWTYFKHQVTATSSTISITGTGGLDEARLHPVVARMTTLTYDPLIGMTSQSGADGKITYFEYDAAGRLSVVRDQERNILKRICYNYAGQVSECSINATASWTATGNLRCATYNGSNTGFQEREEKDTNPYSATYNQTQWVTNGYNTTACPMPATPSSFSAGTGFGIPTSSISLSGSTVSFYIVFYPYSSMTAGNSYLVANISGSCKPTTTRTLSYSSGGRNWTITIYPGGQMYWYLQSGSPSLPANGYVSTTTLSYNL